MGSESYFEDWEKRNKEHKDKQKQREYDMLNGIFFLYVVLVAAAWVYRKVIEEVNSDIVHVHYITYFSLPMVFSGNRGIKNSLLINDSLTVISTRPFSPVYGIDTLIKAIPILGEEFPLKIK